MGEVVALSRRPRLLAARPSSSPPNPRRPTAYGWARYSHSPSASSEWTWNTSNSAAEPGARASGRGGQHHGFRSSPAHPLPASRREALYALYLRRHDRTLRRRTWSTAPRHRSSVAIRSRQVPATARPPRPFRVAVAAPDCDHRHLDLRPEGRSGRHLRHRRNRRSTTRSTSSRPLSAAGSGRRASATPSGCGPSSTRTPPAMPRTTLRFAIDDLDADERRHYRTQQT